MIIQRVKLEAGLDFMVNTDNINKVAFFSNPGKPSDADDIADKNEVGRVDVTVTQDSLNVLFEWEIPVGTANCPFSGITAAVSGELESVITVEDGSDFNSSDEVVEIAYDSGNNPKELEVIGRSGNDITVLGPLPSIPDTSDPENYTLLKVKINQRAFIANGTGSANSGEIFSIENWSFYKDSESPAFQDSKDLDILGG